MYQRILLPTDGSKRSDRAARQAIALVMPVTISQSLKNQFKKQAALASKEILERVRAQAAAAGVACETVSATGDSPYRAILKQAAKSGCDLIMMASHGRKGISGALLGSETAKVLAHSEIPVLVVR